VPPIIDAAEFEAVQALLKTRSPALTAPRVVSGPTLLTGICFCAACGKAMTLRTGKGGRYRYYTCSTEARQGETGCPGRTVPMRDQARADAERAEGALDRLGPTIRRRHSRHSPGRPASACGPRAAATAAITSARSLSASKWTRKKCGSWGRKARSCARSSPLRARKRRVLACPALYRIGAPRSMKVGTTRSLFPYDAAVCYASQSAKLRHPTTLHDASRALPSTSRGGPFALR
jgi:recombinase-like zinc beta ribbon protein